MNVPQGYSVHEGQLWYKDRLVLSCNSQHKEAIIREFHNMPIGGYSGVLRTYKRIAANFYWVGMRQDILNYIQRYDVCQRNKYEMLTLAGLLKPLPIPDQV